MPRPRSTDAIGDTLRCAYRDAVPVPDDLTQLLIAIDRVGRA